MNLCCQSCCLAVHQYRPLLYSSVPFNVVQCRSTGAKNNCCVQGLCARVAISCPCAAAQGGGLGVPSQGNLLDWADKALGQGISTVTRSVKNLLSGARQAPVAAALEALMDGKQVRLGLSSWVASQTGVGLQCCI